MQMLFPYNPVSEGDMGKSIYMQMLFPYNPVPEGDMGKRHIYADAFSL